MQLYVKWQTLVGDARTALDSEALRRATGNDVGSAPDDLETALQTIATTTVYPGIALDDEYIESLIDSYEPLLDAAQDSVARVSRESRTTSSHCRTPQTQ